ncbi:MAG TPA: hypothetical protein VGD80_22035 [Kofleriaceae bacterium]
MLTPLMQVPAPDQIALRPGVIGAVAMTAAIVGTAVSSFFNPQYSTPFSAGPRSSR